MLSWLTALLSWLQEVNPFTRYFYGFPTLPTALTPKDDYGYNEDAPQTLVELNLLRMMASVRDKQRWIEKWQRPDVKAKWLAELTATIEESEVDALRYIEKELDYWAKVSHPNVSPSAVQGVFQADGTVKPSTVNAIRTLFEELVCVSDSKKDWHPGTTNVLDLVHPSLFCAVVGTTQIIPESIRKSMRENMRGGADVKQDAFSYEGQTRTLSSTDILPDKPTPSFYSEKFQWLPSDVSVSEDGEVSFDSYINNLHPEDYKEEYLAIADVLSNMLPLWRETLSHAAFPILPRIEPDMFDLYDDSKEPDWKEDEKAYTEWWDSRRPDPSKLPKPPKDLAVKRRGLDGRSEKSRSASLEHFNLNGKRLQVIVKLGSIELTPEDPLYSGGSWHVEGMQNEAIVATGIYYLDSKNITESQLAFRHAVYEPDYEQGDDPGVAEVYGLHNEAALTQNIGAVTTHEGRLVAFPNHFQHKVSPFELEDKTKPGHRRILCFFLVHPKQRVVSTAVVPPQNPEWFKLALIKNGCLDPMPTVLQEHILKFTSVVPMSLEDAKQYREELMKERSHFQTTHTEELFAREFSLCEH